MTLSDYSYLKEQIVFGVNSSERHKDLLSTLKGLFEDEINSRRRFESITTIGQLLKVLEIRDTLSEDNVRPLTQIAKKLLNCTELLTMIKQYESSHIPREYSNYYNGSQDREYNMNIVYTANNPGSISPLKCRRIVDTVVHEIGNGWRDLARNLDIKESEINDIDMKNDRLPRKAYRLMEVYLNRKADPNNWFLDLCDALNASRRKDLTRSVQKIVKMNI